MNLRDAELSERELPEDFAHRRESVREALGGEQVGCSVYEVAPGRRLWPYHYHRGNEEWLVVVLGRPTLRTPDGERELAVGELVAFPEGEAGAHTLTNRSEAPFRVAIFSTLNRGSVVYPDSGKVGVGGQYFRVGDAVDYWDGE